MHFILPILLAATIFPIAFQQRVSSSDSQQSRFANRSLIAGVASIDFAENGKILA
jgi:hypothetical protein